MSWFQWRHDVTYWYILHDDLYMMMRCHEDTRMLRSTTSSYGWTCDRCHIRGDHDSLHRGYCGWCLAWEEWLGCHHDASPHGRHTWINTSVGSIYDIFWFSWYKNLYVLCFQIYMYYKRNTSGLWLRFDSVMLEKVFDCPWVLKRKINPQM